MNTVEAAQTISGMLEEFEDVEEWDGLQVGMLLTHETGGGESFEIKMSDGSKFRVTVQRESR